MHDRSAGQAISAGTPPPCAQVHMTGGALGILWYALAASPEFVTELYGELAPAALVVLLGPIVCKRHTPDPCMLMWEDVRVHFRV